MTAIVAGARRLWEFGRHIPPRKLARRTRLRLQRRLNDWLGPTDRSLPHLARGGAAEPPLFGPRPGLVAIDGDELAFTFLGQALRMKRAAIDWSAPGSGPEHQLWRMNLHYMEYLESVTDREFEDLVTSWLRLHAVPTSGAWRDSWNAYALSIRAVVWMQQIARRAGRLDPRLERSAEESLVRQLAFLERNLETDIGGNHLVKNLKALLWGAHFFTGAAADRWRRTGLRLLGREIRVQILADGVHYERSPSYHCQVFADLLECRTILPQPDSQLDRALGRMAQALADLVHPDGLVAQFNDSGLTMARSPAECLSAYERLLGARPTPGASFAYPSAGYFGQRSDSYYLVADCGPIAPDDLPAHGHGDVLSIELSVGGKRVFVDQGVFEYVAGPKRHASRTAHSHNTLTISGTDQADFFGAFRCGRRPKTTVHLWARRSDSISFEGSHDGYSNARGAPVHHRRIDADRETILITDSLRSRANHCARVAFLLHPEVEVTRAGKSKLLLSRGGAKVRMTSSVPLACEPAIWWPDMGVELPTLRLFAAAATDEPITTRLDINGRSPAKQRLGQSE